MTDRHAALKAQYEIDAQNHPRPWELWEMKSMKGLWVTPDSWPFDGGPAWDMGKDYRRKPDAPIWPTEPKEAEHLHGWALQELAIGVNVGEFQSRHIEWDNDIWFDLVTSSGALDARWITEPEKWQVRRKPKVGMLEIGILHLSENAAKQHGEAIYNSVRGWPV